MQIVFHTHAKLIGDIRKIALETLDSDTKCANDMALLSSSWSDSEVMIRSLHQYCTAMGITINCKDKDTGRYALLNLSAAPTHPVQPI